MDSAKEIYPFSQSKEDRNIFAPNGNPVLVDFGPKPQLVEPVQPEQSVDESGPKDESAQEPASSPEESTKQPEQSDDSAPAPPVQPDVTVETSKPKASASSKQTSSPQTSKTSNG